MLARGADETLARLHPGAHGDELVLDLQGVDWVRPAVMVGVAALAHRAHAAGDRLAVRSPAHADPAGYATRMRLGHLLDEYGVAHDLPAARPERDQRENLIELAIVDGEQAAARLARLVYRKLAPVDGALARALHKSFGEIGANVPDHSGTIGFMAAQTLPRRRELLVAVADAGIGMRRSLEHRGAVDDERAIELATSPNVSRYDDADRGRGLPTALHLIGLQRGSLYIATGTASIRHFPTTRRYLSAAQPFPGTIVEARIPLS